MSGNGVVPGDLMAFKVKSQVTSLAKSEKVLRARAKRGTAARVSRGEYNPSPEVLSALAMDFRASREGVQIMADATLASALAFEKRAGEAHPF